MDDYLPLKDSGKRKEFDTGAVRDTSEGKGRFDLLPTHALKRVAQTMEKGCAKYSARNWEKGIPLGRFMDSALRHLTQYLGGDRDEDHMAQAAWNVLCFIETEYRIKQGRLPQELDDMPSIVNTFVRDTNQETETVFEEPFVLKNDVITFPVPRRESTDEWDL